jgi:CRP-like cAMP-binding protein
MDSLSNTAPSILSLIEDARSPLRLWAKVHRRDRSFAKDERIPTRSGAIYFVSEGAVRLEGNPLAPAWQQTTRETAKASGANLTSDRPLEKAFLGWIAAGHPFVLESLAPTQIGACAHLDGTAVFWLYPQELDRWDGLSDWFAQAILRQHHRTLAWLSLLAEKRTEDRLLAFLIFWAEEWGVASDRDPCLPYPLTHAQIASAISSTRVTVTRLIGRLQRSGRIVTSGDGLICLPFLTEKRERSLDD